MAFLANETVGSDPAITARFLGCQQDVLSADAWMWNGAMVAYVKVTQEAKLSENDLRSACLLNIGVHQTPRAIIMERIARPAA